MRSLATAIAGILFFGFALAADPIPDSELGLSRTSVFDTPTPELPTRLTEREDNGVYREMAAAGELPLRVYAMYADHPATLEKAHADTGNYLKALRERVGQFIEDGGTLQIGIGSLGDAVAHACILRHRDNAAYRQLVAGISNDKLPTNLDLGEFNEGLYVSTEMFVNGMMHLIEQGVVKLRRQKAGDLLQVGGEESPMFAQGVQHIRGGAAGRVEIWRFKLHANANSVVRHGNARRQ